MRRVLPVVAGHEPAKGGTESSPEIEPYGSTSVLPAMTRTSELGWWLGVLAALAISSTARAVPTPKTPDFNREVLPILSENCFQCHGPDEKAREAKLRLDTKDGLLRTQKPIVLPGKAAQSELFKRLVTKERDDLMPPPKSKKTLTSAQIETVRRWIDSGAPLRNPLGIYAACAAAGAQLDSEPRAGS